MCGAHRVRTHPSHAPVLLAALLASLICGTAHAGELRLPTLFSDHAVLQRDKQLPIWGWADANATVNIEIKGTCTSATADDAGRWRATLPPLKSGGPFAMVVTSGGETRTVRDVYVGDVWLCSGQSNMAHNMTE